MKYKKWLFPILSAAVASVAVFAVWTNIESKDQGDHKVLKSPKITYVSTVDEEPSGETVMKGPRITYVSSATEEPEEILIQDAHFAFVGSSIEELTAEADVIVRGTVSEITAGGTDKGEDGTGLGFEFTLYKFDVSETLKGEVDDSIYIYRPNPGEFSDMPLTAFVVDDALVLYLREGESTYPPVSNYADKAYGTVTLDNGVFDVEATGAVGQVDDSVVVRPRGIDELMFSDGETFTMGDVRRAIEPDSDEVGPVGSTQ